MRVGILSGTVVVGRLAVEYAIAALGCAILAAGVLIAWAARGKRSKESVAEAQRLQELVAAQQVLKGQLKTVTDLQIASAAELAKTITDSSTALTKAVNERLEATQARLGTTLETSAKETAESLGMLVEKLQAIDQAQANITGLSEQVVSLQHVLADKQARGAFGEIQLEDIVRNALPESAFRFQAPLSNGKRVDCLINLPQPPGPIAVDAKFPLTSYQAMLDAPDKPAREACAKTLAADVRAHIKKIAEDYLIAGETAESALMFLPSEAVYAELHAHHRGVIEDGQRARVYLVSPTTMMALLTTIRAVLRDVQMREQAGVIQIEVGKLMVDLRRLSERVGNLKSHFEQASQDVREITISSDKVQRRAAKIREVELDTADEEVDALDVGEGGPGGDTREKVDKAPLLPGLDD